MEKKIRYIQHRKHVAEIYYEKKKNKAEKLKKEKKDTKDK